MAQSQPQRDADDGYVPDLPTVRSVRTSGYGVGDPTTIDVDVEFRTPAHSAEEINATVTFRVHDGVASLKDVQSGARLRAVCIGIKHACESLTDHPTIDQVRGLADILVEVDDEYSRRQEEHAQ